MDKKLKYVMIEENLTVGKVAAMLGVNSAVISHLLANRNKPSYQLTAKIVETFPKYNPNWWLGISETIHNPNCTTTPESDRQTESTTAAESEKSDMKFSTATAQSANSAEVENSTPSIVQNFAHGSAPIERVIVVYADKTFESFTLKR